MKFYKIILIGAVHYYAIPVTDESLKIGVKLVFDDGVYFINPSRDMTDTYCAKNYKRIAEREFLEVFREALKYFYARLPFTSPETEQLTIS